MKARNNYRKGGAAGSEWRMKRVFKIAESADKFKFADLNTDWKYSPAQKF